MANSAKEPVIRKKVVDVNILSVFLVEDHPGHRYVREALMPGLKGSFLPVILDTLPFRSYWILTRKWHIGRVESYEAIVSFLNLYGHPLYVGLDKKSILTAFKLSKELNHDVYDCYYIAAALQENADTVLTTDTDFNTLCAKKSLKYENPIPPSVLKEFGQRR